MSTDRIKVLCRVRPSKGEDAFAWSDRRVHCLAGKEKERSGFLFQKVITPDQGNNKAYNEVKDAVEGVLGGYNATVLAYGHTSAGKTHTMLGTPDEPGVILRSVDYLIDSKSTANITLKISYFEIYLERVFDLLSNDKRELDVTTATDGSTDVVIPGLTVHNISTLSEGIGLISRGQDNRRKARTNLNEHSSRSHTIFQIDIVRADPSGHTVKGQLRLVDLAGSENSKHAGTSGEAMREGANINKSLLALTNVIFSLASKSSHTPYRDAKLTRILQNSLGGNARTRIICCVSPSRQHMDETLQTLHFSDRARVVFNSVKVNEIDGTKTIPLETVSELLAVYQDEISSAHAREKELRSEFKASLHDVVRHMAKEHDAEAFLWCEADYVSQKVSRQSSEDACSAMRLQHERVERDRSKYLDTIRRLESENKKLRKENTLKTTRIDELAIVIQDFEEQTKLLNSEPVASSQRLEEQNQILTAQCISMQADLKTSLSGASLMDPCINALRNKLSGLKRVHSEMCNDMKLGEGVSGGPAATGKKQVKKIKIFEDAVQEAVSSSASVKENIATARQVTSSAKSVVRNPSPLKGPATPKGKLLLTPRSKAKV
eukprot:TRINITY_DN12053_c0_g1_i1.p1 TRINITY_DN12053_c0_g1~~TRINITY_DN12053_c0_g1_i1.p1  ORF type:complete len:612 (+),score=84.92 TRINITY_DN12053_c0_g1_i1:23-1837(+)